MKATKGFALIRPDWEYDQPKGRIHIPDNIEDKHRARVPKWGDVVSLTSKLKTKSGLVLPLDFAEGDKVLMEEYSAEFVEHKGERLLKCPIGKIIAKVENVKQPPVHV